MFNFDVFVKQKYFFLLGGRPWWVGTELTTADFVLWELLDEYRQDKNSHLLVTHHS